MELKNKLAGIIKGELLDDQETLHACANDASLFEVVPKVVARPKDVSDISALVNFVRDHKDEDSALSLTARAAGTGMSGGALNESIIIDVTAHLNNIKGIDDAYAQVEPGVYFRDLEKATLERGLMMPSYPASKDLCAIGGMVGNNAGGEKNLHYGSTKDNVKSMKAVLSDGNEYELKPLSKAELDAKMSQDDFEGEVYKKTFELIENNKELVEGARPKVTKNSTGYFIWDVWDGETFNLARLFVGSQGTLGITTEATLRLVRPKKYSKMLVIFLNDDDFGDLGKIVNTILEYDPESFESYDDHTFSIAVKYFPEMVKKMRARLLTLAFQFLPEFWMIITQGFPKLVLLAEFTGDSKEEVAKSARDAQKAIKQFRIKNRITKNRKDSEKYWTIRRESFSLLRKHIKDKRTAPFIDDIIVRPEQLPEFLPRLNAIMGQYDITFTIAGHIGDANFHIIPLMDFTKPEAKKIFEELSEKVFGLVLEFGGSLSGEHNDGIVRTPYLKKQYGEDVYKIFEQVKNIFDPKNIFNPGKKIGGTWKYTMDHIDTDY